MSFARAPLFVLVSGLVLAGLTAQADPTLAPLFQDHAVLQRDCPLPVWGRADPNEHVQVSFRGQTVGATAEADGRWIVYLEPLSAAIEPSELTVVGKTTLTIQDVLVGEVWLAAGQSNMERRLSTLPDSAAIVAKASHPFIRHFNVLRTVATSPADTVENSGWQVASAATSGEFSAVAWYFSIEIQRKLGVPVGILHSSWGGTGIEAWTDALTLRAVPAWPAIDARWQQALREFPAQRDAYPALFAAWQKEAANAKASGQENPLSWPRPPTGPGTPNALSEIFNGMIAPLQPYALRGTIWYQGESNWMRSVEYAEIFPAMITAWRAQWGLGDFPFFFVQLPNYQNFPDESGRGWAWLREAQAQALRLANTGMAVTIDCGDPADIHPQNKPIVGRRLAQLAEAQVYEITGDWSGPTFASAQREGSTMRVHFDHVATGLTAERKFPQSFELAGADRKFFPADAKIDRDTVVVQSSQVPAPVAVRYAWSNAPPANLLNGAGLPAAPFRSDEW